MTAEAEHDGRLYHLLIDDHVWAWRAATALWTLAGVLFIGMAIPPVREVLFEIDEWVYANTYPFKAGAVTGIAYTLNFIGGGLFAWPFRVAITAFLAVKRRWESVAAWVLAIALSEPLIFTLKMLYGRDRPPEALVEATSGSFPSGHAIGGAVMAVGLVVALVPAGAERRNLEIAAAAFAFLMSGSRMYLGAHYLFDVVAGVALGAAIAIGVAVLVHRAFLRHFVDDLAPQLVVRRPGSG